jgi:hypothetical protein
MMKKVLTLEEYDQIIEGLKPINTEEYDHDFITSVMYEKFEVVDKTDREINETFNLYLAEGAISNFIALSTNPITGIKLANNAKKLAKAHIQNATAKIDFEKKIQAAERAKDKNPEKADQAKKAMEIAKSAYATKKEVAADQIEAIQDRMGELSKDDPKLSKVSALLKTKARVEANKKLLRILDTEERKQLQLTIKDQEEKAKNAEAQMADYVSSEKEKDAADKGGESTDQKVKDLQDKIDSVQDKIGKTEDPEDKAKLSVDKAKLNQEKAKEKGEDLDKANFKVAAETARLKYVQDKTPQNYLEYLKTSLKYDESAENPNKEAIDKKKEAIKDWEEKVKAKPTEKPKGDKTEQEIADLNKKKEDLAAKIADQREGVDTSNKLYTDALNKRDSIKDTESPEWAKAAEEYSAISSERQADLARLSGLEAQLKTISQKISDLQAKKKK